MINQEALNTLYESSLNKVSSVEKEKAYQTLQKAIDNEELYKKGLNKAIKYLIEYDTKITNGLFEIERKNNKNWKWRVPSEKEWKEHLLSGGAK